MSAPVILCGKTEQIGQGVIATLKPEYDGMSQSNIFRLCQAHGDTHKGHSKPPVAVILGAGYDDAGARAMMKASAGIRPIPWLRPDTTKPAPPLGPEYGKALVARVKELLARLEQEGKMGEEIVRWY